MLNKNKNKNNKNIKNKNKNNKNIKNKNKTKIGSLFVNIKVSIVFYVWIDNSNHFSAMSRNVLLHF
jgi:hypothetical protein